MKIKPYPLPLRTVSLLLAAIMPLGTTPGFVLAAATPEPARQADSTTTMPEQTPPQKARPVHVNRRAPSNTILSLAPKFSAQPTEAELFQAHVFPHPLVPVGKPTAEENKALAKALAGYVKRGNADDQSILLGFLKQYPNSAWKPALLLNVGIAWRQSGYFSRAADAWKEAWNLSKNETEINAKALADQILSELTQLYAWVGDNEKLEPLLAGVDSRQIIGGSREMIASARQARWVIDNRPDEIFKCGPEALRQVLSVTQTNADARVLFQKRATKDGFSLTQLKQLSDESGMNYQMAKRTPGSIVPPNSVVHWKLNHYGVVVKEQQGRYLVRDTTLTYLYGPEFWISKAALDEEASGYFLIPTGPLPAGWETVTPEEGRKIFGKGQVPGPDPNAFTPCDSKTCSECNTHAMARYSAHLMLVSLNIVDTPIGYTPPRGPAVEFTVTYNQRDYTSQYNPNYSNLGVGWTFDWFSYIADNGADTNRDSVSRYVSGGGVVIHGGYNSSTGIYSPDRDGKVLQYIATNDTYELAFPDGSKQIFGQPGTASPGPRNVFLTGIKDPAGNTVQIFYDELGRISYVNDALGQTTTLYYDMVGDANQYKITRVEDPFGRTAYFEYDTLGRLTKITDIIGISSAFEYDPVYYGYIKRMTTPYGTSTFDFGGDPSGNRWLTMTDPNGDTEKVIYQDNGYAGSELEAPPGVDNTWLQYRNTFYFDKKAYQMSNNGNNLAYATIYHWLHDTDNGAYLASGILESIKPPLESRIWFLYPGQWYPRMSEGITLRRPSVITRVVDDPVTTTNYQTYHYGYNSQGLVTNFTDPLGRQITLDYYPNGIDLQKVRQTTGANNEVLAEFGDYNSQHLPSTYTNAARQTYTLGWNSYGQLTNVLNPKNEITCLNYDSNGYLQNIQKLWSGGAKTTSLGYDGYGRIQAVTNSDNYFLAYSYDALNRLTNVTYPDQTFEQYDYDRLDMVRARDRAGKYTRITYDGVGHPLSVIDRLGQTNLFSWCGCGGLDSITDPLGHVTAWQYDVEGRVTGKDYFDSTVTHYAYDSRAGNLKSVTDAKSQVKHYTYNLDDSLTNVTYTGAIVPTPSVSFTYDTNYNRLAAMTDGTGTTVFDYYPVTTGGTLGARRLHTVDGPLANDTISYQYDELGRVINRAINSVGESVAYDSLGRITNHTSVLGTFVPAYVDATRRLASLAYPNGQTTVFSYYGIANDERLQQIQNLAPNAQNLSTFGYTYDVLGRITQWTQQTDANTPDAINLDYDNEDQLLGALIAPQGQAAIKNYAYGYDAAGNRTQEQIESSGTFSVTSSAYNNVNQLLAQSGVGSSPILFKGKINEPATATVNGVTAKMTQDAGSTNNGKIFTATLTLPVGSNVVTIVATDFGANGGNKTTNNYAVNVVGGEDKTFGYDLNGNMTNDSAGISYEYDAENRTTAINRGTANRTEFSYDGFGRRVQIIEKTNGVAMSTNKYIWCGLQLSEERDSSGANVTKRFFAEGEQIGGVSYYFTRDHLGSIREMTDSSGAIQVRYDYDPYGVRTKVQGSIDADFGFTGHFIIASQPETTFTLNRLYRTDLGRWLSRDPIEEAGGLNLYDYVDNDPVNWIDPFGLWKDPGHQQLTEVAMKNWGFSQHDINIAVNANLNVDRLSNQGNNAAHYMPGSEAEAQNLINDLLNQAEAAEACGQHDAAMDLLGQALHTTQDRWAHSEQNAGWMAHVTGNPDSPTEHMNEYINAYRDTKQLIQTFVEDTQSY